MLLAAWIITVVPLHAQTPAKAPIRVPANVLAEAAATLTEAALTRHLDVLAHDSMRNRETPSAALERTAQYIANEFQKLGLLPGADRGRLTGGSWFQRYPLPGQRTVDDAKSQLSMNWEKPGEEVVVTFSGAARIVSPIAPEGVTTMPALAPLLVTGQPTAASLAEVVSRATREGKVVFYLPPTRADSLAVQQVIAQRARFSYGLAIVSDDDSITFARNHEIAQRQQRPIVVNSGLIFSAADSSWTVHVRLAAIENLFRKVGVDLAHLRRDTVPRIHEMPRFGVKLYVQADTTRPIVTAPNVIGVLPGSNRNNVMSQPIVFSVRMDHRSAVDSTRGRNEGDNALGIAGLIELAKAFSRPEMRPRRALVFVVVSGSTQDFWGSQYFAGNMPWTLRHYRTGMLNITIDLSGQQRENTVMVDGLDDVDLVMRPSWVAATHSELGLTVVEGGTAQPTADHVSFARTYIPGLYVYTNPHGASGQVLGERRPLNAERVVPVLRLLFYLGHELVSATLAPRWSTSGRQQRQFLNRRP